MGVCCDPGWTRCLTIRRNAPHVFIGRWKFYYRVSGTNWLRDRRVSSCVNTLCVIFAHQIQAMPRASSGGLRKGLLASKMPQFHKNSRRLWPRSRRRNPGAFPKAGPIFQQPFPLPESAQTLPKIAFRAAGKSGKSFPAAYLPENPSTRNFRPPSFSKQGSTPTPCARVCKTKSKNGRSKPRTAFISRAFCAPRGIEQTMVSDHGLRRGPDQGVDPETLILEFSDNSPKHLLRLFLASNVIFIF